MGAESLGLDPKIMTSLFFSCQAAPGRRWQLLGRAPLYSLEIFWCSFEALWCSPEMTSHLAKAWGLGAWPEWPPWPACPQETIDNVPSPSAQFTLATCWVSNGRNRIKLGFFPTAVGWSHPGAGLTLLLRLLTAKGHIPGTQWGGDKCAQSLLRLWRQLAKLTRVHSSQFSSACPHSQQNLLSGYLFQGSFQEWWLEPWVPNQGCKWILAQTDLETLTVPYHTMTE